MNWEQNFTKIYWLLSLSIIVAHIPSVYFTYVVITNWGNIEGNPFNAYLISVFGPVWISILHFPFAIGTMGIVFFLAKRQKPITRKMMIFTYIVALALVIAVSINDYYSFLWWMNP